MMNAVSHANNVPHDHCCYHGLDHDRRPSDMSCTGVSPLLCCTSGWSAATSGTVLSCTGYSGGTQKGLAWHLSISEHWYVKYSTGTSFSWPSHWCALSALSWLSWSVASWCCCHLSVCTSDWRGCCLVSYLINKQIKFLLYNKQ